METLAMLGLGPDGVPSHQGPGMKHEDGSLATFRVHKDAVSGLHLQGDILYSASFDSTVCAVDLHRGVAVPTTQPLLSHTRNMWTTHFQSIHPRHWSFDLDVQHSSLTLRDSLPQRTR